MSYETELPGNRPLRRQLSALADSGRLHHCLIFEGPAGVGKANMAMWLASRMNCESKLGAPCGQCWPCRAIAKGHHPDVLKVGLDPERTARLVSVRQAREVLAALALRPHSARRRFVIIDPADAMNVEAANALLKTFEEPPADTGFVLVTDQPGALLATVRSRAQRVRLSRVDHDEMVRWLEGRGVADPIWIARMAEGCPARALALAEGEGVEWRAARDEILAAIAGDIGGLFAFGETRGKGERTEWVPWMARAFDGVERMLQDAWRLHVHPDTPADSLYNPDLRPRVEQWARHLDAAGVARCHAAIVEARQQIDAFVNGRVLVDALLCRLATELGPARKAS